MDDARTDDPGATLGVTTDHTCPVEWAADHGLLEGSPVERSWCLSYHLDAVTSSSRVDAMAPELLLWKRDALSIFYAPWDWVNTAAKVMLVGITPGLHQATEALREARRCLAAGLSIEETLRRADAVGSFSGTMRTNLVAMLDGIGLADALGTETTARLFDEQHHLAAHCSAIDYPVFVNGQNYGGATPPLVGHPVLASLVRACLGARVAMVPNALIVPLGKAAEAAVSLLVGQGLVDRRRCLLGMPHPSGANGHRQRHYAERRPELAKAVTAWASA
jgi:hypothetical protein